MADSEVKLSVADAAGLTEVGLEQWLHMYEQMARIRAFEEQVNQLYLSAKMPGLAHLYIGQEAVAVGVCEALTRNDYITSTHRGHGHCIAKGASTDRMFAELLGRAAGYCRGKGGSMHIADQETGNLGANAIVGGSAGIATGAAFTSERVNGQDIRQVYTAANRLVGRARGGNGPAFLQCDTYRFMGHHVGDIDRTYYRTKDEERTWREERDPLPLLKTWLLGQGQADQSMIDQIEREIRDEIAAAVQFALDAPYPDAHEVTQHVYA